MVLLFVFLGTSENLKLNFVDYVLIVDQLGDILNALSSKA